MVKSNLSIHSNGNLLETSDLLRKILHQLANEENFSGEDWEVYPPEKKKDFRFYRR